MKNRRGEYLYFCSAEQDSLYAVSYTHLIGIDLGIKDLAICSDGNTYKNINKSQTVKKLEKCKRRLQRLSLIHI